MQELFGGADFTHLIQLRGSVDLSISSLLIVLFV